jgi:hypothetical protein
MARARQEDLLASAETAQLLAERKEALMQAAAQQDRERQQATQPVEYTLAEGQDGALKRAPTDQLFSGAHPESEEMDELEYAMSFKHSSFERPLRKAK